MTTAPRHPPARYRRIRTAILSVVVAVLVTGAGLLYAVHAERRAAEIIQPYDPLPRW